MGCHKFVYVENKVVETKNMYVWNLVQDSRIVNETGVSLLCLDKLLIRRSWNPQVYVPMAVLDLDHSDNHRRAPR